MEVLHRYAQRYAAFGDVKIHLAERRVSCAAGPLDLAQRELDLLLVLVDAQGSVVSRADLARRVWDRDLASATNVLDVFPTRLRKRLAGSGVRLTTVQG